MLLVCCVIGRFVGLSCCWPVVLLVMLLIHHVASAIITNLSHYSYVFALTPLLLFIMLFLCITSCFFLLHVFW
jgi:hypothetical protein